MNWFAITLSYDIAEIKLTEKFSTFTPDFLLEISQAFIPKSPMRSLTAFLMSSSFETA